eukprot:g16175.t1
MKKYLREYQKHAGDIYATPECTKKRKKKKFAPYASYENPGWLSVTASNVALPLLEKGSNDGGSLPARGKTLTCAARELISSPNGLHSSPFGLSLADWPWSHLANLVFSVFVIPPGSSFTPNSTLQMSSLVDDMMSLDGWVDDDTSSDSDQLQIAHDWLGVTIEDYVSDPDGAVRVVELEDLSPNIDVSSILDQLEDHTKRVQRKAHFSLMVIDSEGNKKVLKKKDRLSKLRGLQYTRLYYINVNRITIGRDYWCPQDSARPLHYRASKAFVKEVLGDQFGLPLSERQALYTFYTRIADYLRPLIHAGVPEGKRLTHRDQIEYIKYTIDTPSVEAWSPRPEHLKLIDECVRTLQAESYSQSSNLMN